MSAITSVNFTKYKRENKRKERQGEKGLWAKRRVIIMFFVLATEERGIGCLSNSPQDVSELIYIYIKIFFSS